MVAVEVRRLAQSAVQASAEVKALIEQSGMEVHGGSKLVSSAADKLGGILEAVHANSSLIAEIAAASTGQTEGQAVELGRIVSVFHIGNAPQPQVAPVRRLPRAQGNAAISDDWQAF